MKIYQFMPNSLNKAPETKVAEKAAGINKPQAGGPAKTGEADFASILKSATTRAPAGNGPGGTISQENQRALQLPSPGDLGRAGRLLNLLGSDIRAATPEALRNVHNLEGLVYVYSK